MNIDKNKLYANFWDTNNKNNISNLGIVSCNILASKENIESNIGFYLLLIILAIFIIIFIIFCSKGYSLIENKIDDVIYKKFNDEDQNRNKKRKKSLNQVKIIKRKFNKKSKIKSSKKKQSYK